MSEIGNARGKVISSCYRCDRPATSREHFPPKAFFPRGGNLQLKTVPSCAIHNNGKSKDDLYLLTHISINAGSGENLPKKIFTRSILPSLKRSPAFRAALLEGAEWLSGGARRYPVELSRFDDFFDGFVSAVYFDRYGSRFNDRTHRLRHVYISLESDDPFHQAAVTAAKSLTQGFFDKNAEMVSHFEAAKIDEVVYANSIMDPCGPDASITIAHVFYGVFRVVSYLTLRMPWEREVIFGRKQETYQTE